MTTGLPSHHLFLVSSWMQSGSLTTIPNIWHLPHFQSIYYLSSCHGSFSCTLFMSHQHIHTSFSPHFSALPCRQITLLVTKELQFSLQHICFCQQVNITRMKEADVSHSISNPHHFLDTSYWHVLQQRWKAMVTKYLFFQTILDRKILYETFPLM